METLLRTSLRKNGVEIYGYKIIMKQNKIICNRRREKSALSNADITLRIRRE